MAIITNASLYIGSLKYGEVATMDWTLTNGGEPQIADGGYIGHSMGNPTTKVTFNTIVPYGNTTVAQLAQAVQSGKTVDLVGGVIGDKIWTCKGMSVVTATVKSDATKRTLMGDFEATGGKTDFA